jgi:hypothetical protein
MFSEMIFTRKYLVPAIVSKDCAQTLKEMTGKTFQDLSTVTGSRATISCEKENNMP